MRIRFGLLSVLVFSGMLSLAGSSFAGSINVSTGLDASDVLLTLGGSNDAHWTVDQPRGGTAPAKVVAQGDPGSAIPIWKPNGPGSTWITIDNTSVGNAPVVPYSYYRSFTLTASDLLNASLSGTWGIDDGGELRLNGTVIGSASPDYSASTPFNVPTGSSLFTVGVNLLEIRMTNSDNFLEAVRLEGFVNLAPEPSTIVVALTGLGLAIVARRRAKA